MAEKKGIERDCTKREPLARLGFVLAACDVLAFLATAWLAQYVRYGQEVPSTHRVGPLLFAPLLTAIQLYVAYAAGLYDFRHRPSKTDHLFGGIAAALLGVVLGYGVLALAQIYLAQFIEFSRLVAVYQVVLLTAWFRLSRGCVIGWLRRTGWRVRSMLVGPVQACRALRRDLNADSPELAECVGMAVLEDIPAGDGVIGSVRDIEALGSSFGIDQIILAGIGVPQDELHSLLRSCEATGSEIYLHPDLNLAIFSNARVVSLSGVPLVPLQPLAASRHYGALKRVLDVILCLALLLMTAPLLLVSVLAVRLTSRGPVLFVQERVGLRGKVFPLRKLRTMFDDAEAGSGPVLAEIDDPRVTPVGRWLRRTRVDELPQLWNVVRGDMSLVGPRPERPVFVERFKKETPLYERRLLIKPGLTGLAQIHGRYDTGYRQKLRYDLVYMNQCSLALDLRILWATVRTVLTGRGAA
jgi:exopolysaccharide biosynthesis polyprenyl glycosylphosphotransferase